MTNISRDMDSLVTFILCTTMASWLGYQQNDLYITLRDNINNLRMPLNNLNEKS